jgi:hypothetical protein
VKHSKVQEAIATAREFITKAEKLKPMRNCDFVDYGKDSGAARRASLDLTRKLAEMRKP